MDNIRVGPIRNVAIVSNAGAGKTSLSEAILFTSGAVPVFGSIAQGTTVSDFEPEELHHRSSVSTSVLQFFWNQTTLSLLDPPGALSLLGEPLSALRAVDAVLIVLDGQAGVRTELSRLWVRIDELGLPCLFFVNGLDRDGASIDHALEICRTQLNCIPIPMVVPVGSGPQMEGVIDILHERFIGSGPATAKVEIVPLPAHCESAAKEGRARLLEAVAETEDALLNAYVAQGDLSPDMLFSGLRSGILRRQVFPLYAGSAVRNLGVWSLLNALTALLPLPSERCAAHPSEGVQPSTHLSCERKGSVQEPFSAFVFKTLIDPFVGRLSYCRLLSGTVQADSLVWNASKQMREKLGHFYTLFGKRHTAVASASAEEIVAIGKLHDTYTGDTLCDETDQICYPAIGLPRPVLSSRLRPRQRRRLRK